MKKSFLISNQYMLIPVSAEKETKVISFFCDGIKIYEFAVPVNQEEGEFYSFNYFAPLSMKEYVGKNVIIDGDIPEIMMNAVSFSDHMPVNTQSRPLIHFTPNTGWINDPNGLIYQNGIYQMYFQHNPFDTRWQNMCWGHAYSKDLLHWEQVETALYPDCDGTMFSGSGIVNEKGLLGLPEDAQIYFYTCAGGEGEWSKDKVFTQKIAYTAGGGNTVHKMDGFIVENFVKGNRDPKVYWHEETSAYYMALYLDKNDFMILRSTDLQNWETSHKFELKEAWECPDLRAIPVEGGGSKWMFWSADGFYFLGNFDGYKFETDNVKHMAYCTKVPYAAQTWWGTEDVITIPWLRTSNKGKMYTGAMGIPRKMTLAQTEEGLKLRQVPVDQYMNSRNLIFKLYGMETSYEVEQETAVEISINAEKEVDFDISIYGTPVNYSSSTGILTAGEEKVQLSPNLKDFNILTDGEILEISANNYLEIAIIELLVDRKKGIIEVKASETAEIEIFSIK